MDYNNKIEKLKLQGFRIVGVEENTLVLSNDKYP